MGIFVKDSNINTGTVGSQGTNTQSVTVHNTTIDVSNIERGNSDINTESQVTTVDLGDLINEGTSTAAEAANTTITNGNINVGDTTQTASQTSNQNMQNSNTNTENINQQGESVTKHSIDNDQTKQDNVNQETGTASSKSASTGGQGGSTNQPTGTASKPASSSTGGKSGSSSGGQGGSANSGSMSAQGKQGAQGQKAGEVSGKAGSIKNTQSKVLELGGDVSRTGATISNQKSITSKTKTTQGNSNKAHSNTGSKIGKGVRWFVKEIVHTVESIRATEAVLTTTVMSAAGRILEKVFVDGLVGYVVAGVMDLAGEDDIANDLRKFAARNLVEEANTWFYENTEMGRHINELSAIKYDSELAKKIESFSETAIKIAASTAISLVPGGVFILAAVGALEGMGGAAESAYQNALANGEEDLTLSLWSNLGILGSGALDAVAWIFNAKLGKGFLSIAGDIGEIGLKETAINFGKQLFSKETLHNILDPKNLLPNMGQSALQSGEEIGRIFSKYMNGEELTAEDWWKLAKTYGTYLFLNVVQDVLTDSIQNYNPAKQPKKVNYETEKNFDDMTPEERSKAWSDYLKQKYGSENVTHENGLLTIEELKAKYPCVDAELIEEYPEVYRNPLYHHCVYDPETGELIKVEEDWPQAEGAAEYAAHGWDNERLLNEGIENGVDALVDAGARRVEIEELYEEEGRLSRIAVKDKIEEDQYAEYFGGGKIEGLDDRKHRVLGPKTTSRGKEFFYEFDNDASFERADKKATASVDSWTDVWQDASGKKGKPYTGEVHVVAIETHAADWFDQEGGAKQISFYLTDADGHILVKDNKFLPEPQLYKLNRTQLIELGILKKTWD